MFSQVFLFYFQVGYRTNYDTTVVVVIDISYLANSTYRSCSIHLYLLVRGHFVDCAHFRR